MPFKIRPKRSGSAGRKPAAAQLDVGEIALNMADRKMFFKDAANAIQELDGSAGQTNLGISRTPTQITITSNTGNDVAIPGAGTNAGIMTKTHVDELNKALADAASAKTASAANKTSINALTTKQNDLLTSVGDLGINLGNVLLEVSDITGQIEVMQATIKDLVDAVNNISGGAPVVPPEVEHTAIIKVTANNSLGTANANFTYYDSSVEFGGSVNDRVTIQVPGTADLRAFYLANIPAGWSLANAYVYSVTWIKTDGSTEVDGKILYPSLAGSALNITIPATRSDGARRNSVTLVMTFRK